MSKVIYTPLSALSVTNDADQDIWELASPATHKIALHGWELTSAEMSAESVRLRLLRGTASGSGGGTGTEVLREPDDSPITGVVETLNTTPGTDGDVLQEWVWEQLGPIGQVYTPEMRPVIDVSSWLKLNLATAVASTRTWYGWLCWEEL